MPKTYIIAEIGVNHNGALETAKEMIEVAAQCGADSVKFQTYKSEYLVTPEAKQAEYQTVNTGKTESQYDMLKRLELSHDDHRELLEKCASEKIDFLSSAFDIESADFLINDLGLKTIKLGSGELTNAPLLHFIAKHQVKIILSTGMANPQEIKEALGVLSLGYKNITPSSRKDFQTAYDADILSDKTILLHCTSDYPAKPEDINLNAMTTLQSEFDLPVGYSDHSVGPEISIAAVAQGAKIIEKHFTLDRSMEGPDHKASMTPKEFKTMVQSIRNVAKALGDGIKMPKASEEKTKQVARKSIVACSYITKGQELDSKNITTKRPENGLSPFEYWDMLGKKAKQDYSENDIIIPDE